MNTIRCMVADDELLAREILETYIAQVANLQLVASCNSAMAVLNTLKTTAIDLLFLDIKMPGLSGLELLRTLPNPPVVIFTTAHREHALDAFSLNAIDYLLKPVSMERFLQAVHKYERLRTPASSEAMSTYLDIKSGKKTLRIPLADILYIEGLKDYVKVHTTTQTLVTYQTLSALEAALPASQFIRIHRSYIISKLHITAYSPTQVTLTTQEIPIGLSYQEEALKRIGS